MRALNALAVAFLLLGACTTGVPRAAILNSLIGQPETELIQQLGVPSRSFETGGKTFLAYTERRVDLVPSPGFYGGGFGYWGGGFGFAGFPPEAIERVCETTFEIADHRVAAWTLRGNAC